MPYKLLAGNAYIGLGSNLGDRLLRLQEACHQLTAVPGLVLLRSSAVFESPAWGYESSNAFLNAVLELSYDGSVWTLFDHLLAIQETMGRDSTARVPRWRLIGTEQAAAAGAEALSQRIYTDRSIDLDLLWFAKGQPPRRRRKQPAAGLKLDTPLLQLPHPEAQRRAFVLVPWAELAPDLELQGRLLADWRSGIDTGRAALSRYCEGLLPLE